MKTKQYEATLVRGQTYILGALKFERGTKSQTQVVDEATKKKLEQRAVDRMTLQGADGKEAVVKQKFIFKEVKATAHAKGDKAKELEAMSGDGGVDFAEDETDEDAGEEESEEQGGDDTDDFVDDEGDDDDTAPPKTNARSPGVKKKAGKKAEAGTAKDTRGRG